MLNGRWLLPILFSFRRSWIFIAVLIIIIFGSTPSFAQIKSYSFFENLLKQSDSVHSDIMLGDQWIAHSDFLRAVYEATDYELAWKKSSNIDVLLNAIQGADQEGLCPEDYRLKTLEAYYFMWQKNEQQQVYFDLLLTDAYLRYASHLRYGKISPEVLFPEDWETEPHTIDIAGILIQALDEEKIESSLEELKPKSTAYFKLKNALQYYKGIKRNGGWPIIADGPSIEPFAIDEKIATIRERLFITGELSSYPKDDNFYDTALLVAVKKFQHQNGLINDGIIGKSTLEVFSNTVDDYIAKVEINLERYRWLPRQLGQQFVYVNIPEFVLYVFENDSIALSMKVILGKPERNTPVFSSNIRYLILNPTWTVPHTILEEDVLPEVKKNVNYLSTHHLRVIDQSGAELSPDSLKWSTYTIDNFPYMLRQDPGQFNSLGLIKFQFPNHYTIFLHDTNLHSLFSKSYRALSSGCIRIEKPFELAAYLLNERGWTLQRLKETIEEGETKTVVFPKPIPIHLVYFTAIVEADRILFLNDLYGWDKMVAKKLQQVP